MTVSYIRPVVFLAHLLDVDHDKRVDFRVLLLIEAAVCERHAGWLFARVAALEVLGCSSEGFSG